MTSSSVPPCLSASDRESFAYSTVKDRMPVILCRVVDILYRNRANFETKEEQEELKIVLERMIIDLETMFKAKLRYEMQTDKPLVKFLDEYRDKDVWNDYIEKVEKSSGKSPTWFTTHWLFAECYMYRRLLESVLLSPPLSNLDVFRTQKEEAMATAKPAIRALSHFLYNEEEMELKTRLGLLIKMCLWANKCDLSISHGVNENHFESFEHPEFLVAENQCFLLIDHIKEVCNSLLDNNDNNNCVDYVLDNVGFELFCDLALVNFLIDNKIVDKVRVHAKSYAWFVSDATPSDITWTLNQLLAMNDFRVTRLATSIGTKMEQKLIEVRHHDFWTFPHAFWEMREASSDLFDELSTSKLVFFKGDLNYRKLVGDRKWTATEKWPAALMGFTPTSVLALRTLKADVVVGLPEGAVEALNNIDAKWMVNGQWGLIHMFNKKNCEINN